MADGFTVAEAAKRTGHSVQTINRWLKLNKGSLIEVTPRVSPKRLTVDSVNAERAAVLQRLGVVEATDAPANPSDRAAQDLQAAFDSLKHAHAHLAQTLLHMGGSSDGSPPPSADDGPSREG